MVLLGRLLANSEGNRLLRCYGADAPGRDTQDRVFFSSAAVRGRRRSLAEMPMYWAIAWRFSTAGKRSPCSHSQMIGMEKPVSADTYLSVRPRCLRHWRSRVANA